MTKSSSVLFILDDATQTAALQQGLESKFAVEFCCDAGDAVQHMARSRPDILVLSFQGDSMSPLALAHIMRQSPQLPYVGLIYLSQSDSMDWFEPLIAAGVDVCLPESSSLQQMTSALEATTELCRAKAVIQKLQQEFYGSVQRPQSPSPRDSAMELGNRQFLQRQLRLEFKRAHRYQKHLILILLRLDAFNVAQTPPQILDETLLKKVQETIGSIVRFEIDFTGRSRESEFFAILPETDIDGAISVAERMRSQIAQLHSTADGKHLASSVGVVHYNGDRGNFTTVEEFYLTAEAAVAAAEAHGGDQYWALDDPGEDHSDEQSA